MIFTPTPIPGAIIIKPNCFDDARGKFVKVFHRDAFASHGIDFRPVEEFYTVSHQGVVRGMHFQTPPAAHDKLIWCVGGHILDVVLDLRKGSPAFGKFHTLEMNPENRLSLFIPAGVAHGFLTLDRETTVMYSVNSMHDPACDRGVRWDSFGLDWPCANPILSARDSALPPLAEFESPFVFAP